MNTINKWKNKEEPHRSFCRLSGLTVTRNDSNISTAIELFLWTTTYTALSIRICTPAVSCLYNIPVTGLNISLYNQYEWDVIPHATALIFCYIDTDIYHFAIVWVQVIICRKLYNVFIFITITVMCIYLFYCRLRGNIKL